MLDPSTIDQVVSLREEKNVDIASNSLERTFPRGLETSVFSFTALEKAYREAKESWERVHVTQYIYNNPQVFTQANLKAQGKLRRPDLRITVDTEEDYMLVNAIYYFLGEESMQLEKVIDLLKEQPWLAYINKNVEQKKAWE